MLASSVFTLVLQRGKRTIFDFAVSDLSVGNGNVAPSVVKSLADREKGANSETVAYRPEEIGNRGKRWKTVLNGRY